MLWTRLTGAAEQYVGWRVARDEELSDVVAAGSAVARPEADGTVAVTVDGLEPATTYWYGFEAAGEHSPTGRTRTVPAAGTTTERIRLGVVCCAHWRTGYFNAYGRLADRDVDAVVHLGDSIYEDDPKKDRGPRRHDPFGRLRTLADYRARYAQYRTDPDFQALLRRHPMVATWDDHELAGNAWWDGAGGHDPAQDGPWADRRAAAVRAYHEWTPMRRPDPADPYRVWRRVGFGGLADMLMLDTRLEGREKPVAGRRPIVGIRRRDRSLLGEGQWRWLADALAAPDRATWGLVLSQVVVAPVHLVGIPGRAARFGRRLGAVGGGFVVNSGQWDGYPGERRRLLDLLARRDGDTLVVSGDLHSSWVSVLQPEDDPRRGGAVATEFVTPAVSAPSFARALGRKFPGGRPALERAIRRMNPHVRFVDTAGHGYLLLDVTPERITAEWWHVDTVRRRDPGEHLAARWILNRGERAARRV